MQPQRLAIVTRRFWPYCGPAEMDVAEVAAAIAQTGQPIEVLTIRWQKDWPRSFQYRELDITRIGRPFGGPWGMFRYLRRLNRHVKDSQIEGLIVYGLTEESWAAIRSFATKMPVVVRLQGEGMAAAHPRKTSNTKPRPLNPKQLAILNNVKKILVDSQRTADELIRHGSISKDLVSIVPPCVRVISDSRRSLSRQGTARSGLTDAHPILQIEPTQPLVVCGSPRFTDAGMLDLVNAWPQVLDAFPTARLWILGDGLKAHRLWDRICELELAHSIVMPGFFDDLDEVLQAADVFVHPLQEDHCCGVLIRALAAGICTVATEMPETRRLIENGVSGILTTPNPPAAPAAPTALAEAIAATLADSELRGRLGRAAQRRSIARFNLTDWIDRYLDPLLVNDRAPADSTSPLSSFTNRDTNNP